MPSSALAPSRLDDVPTRRDATRSARDDARHPTRRTRPVRDPVSTLIEENLPLVGHIVRQMAVRLPEHVAREDLTSAGMAALVSSAKSFDPDRGIPFAGFATIRIRGAVVDELRSMDWASRSVRGRARQFDAVRSELMAALGRTPRAEEVAAALGVTVAELGGHEADVARASLLSIQGFAPETGAALVRDHRNGPEQLLLDREQLGYLHEAIAELPERLGFVVRTYFFEQRQMAEIAAELGVTASRVSQMRAEALKLLRHVMAGAQGGTATVSAQSDRARASTASYAAAVAARGSLSSRLGRSSPLGDVISATYLTAASVALAATTKTSASA